MADSQRPLDVSFLTTVVRVFTYGRCVVGASFAVMFLLYGAVLNTFTIFVDPMATDLGCGRGPLSVAMMTGALGMGAAAPIAGKLMDRIGAKPVMLVGALTIGVGILLASRATALWHLYIAYAFVGIGLAGATMIPCSLIISNWFISRRGLAMGIMAMGTSTGGMLMAPVANWIIQNHGWRAAYVFSGTVILTVGLSVIAFLLKPHPSDAGLEPYVGADDPARHINAGWGFSVTEAFRMRVFWQIAAVMFVLGVVTSGVGAHVVPCLTDFGHTPTRSAYAWSVTLFVMTVAKFSFGPISDRWGSKNAMAAACGLMSIALVVLSFATAYEIVMVFAVLYGFGVGAPLTVNPLLVGESLGVRNFGALYGILNLISIVGAAIGPVAMGVASDVQKSYLSILYLFVILMAVVGVVALFIRPAARETSMV
jgi:MFS family permease